MKQMNFKFDDKTVDLIKKLKEEFDLKSSSAVIRRALALLKVVGDANYPNTEIIIRKTVNNITKEKVIIMT